MVFKNLKKAQAKSEKRLHSDAIRLIGIDERSNGVLAASCPDFQRSKSEIFIKAYDDVSVSTKESYLQIAFEAAQNLVRLQPKCKISSLFLIKLLFNHTAGPTDIEAFCSIEKECERIISVLKEQEQEEEDKTTNEILNFWEYSTNLVKSYVEKRSLMAMWRFDEEKYTEAIEIAQITRDRVMDWGFTHRFLAGLYEELAFRFEDKKHTYLNSAFDCANAAVSLCDEPIEYTCFHIAVMIRRGAYDIEELTSEFRNLEDIEEDGCDSYTSLIDSWTGLENPNQFRRPILEFSNKFLPDGDVQLDNTFRPFAKLGDWCDHEKAKVKGVCAKLCNQLALTEEHSTVRRFSPVDNDELRFQKQRVVRLWNGLSHDKKRSFLTASFKDFAKTLEPADREFVLEAIVFANDNKGSSKHYVCYYPDCAEKSVSEASYWKHIGRHMNSKDKKFLKTLPENLPQILKDEWLSSFSDGRWEPVDFNTAMKSAQTSPEPFIQKDDLWPFVEDPARASLLHDLRYLLQSLNTLGFLTEGHLDSMTTYSMERLCAEPLQLAWSKCHICFCCLELTALRELVNALVDLFEVCSKISQRRDPSLVYAFENQGISLVVNNVSGLTVEDSTLIDGADFLDSLYSGPSFKDLVEWWRSLREERNIHAELLAQTLTSQYVRYTKRILESRSVHQHDILVLNETDTLLNRARIAIHQLKCKIFDTAVDSYDELLWALMKPHIQGRLRQALLDCVDS